MKITHWLLGLMLLSIVATTQAEIIATPEEIDNLGIELQAPQTVDRVSVIEALARVVLPINAEYVISAVQPGLLVRLHAAVGDEVTKGDALAEIRSAEFLARQREFLDAVIQNNLAENQRARDQQLFEEGIISERRLQDTAARAKAAAATFNEHREVLRYSGLTEAEIRSLASQQRLRETQVIRAPLDGVVMDATAVAGEHVEAMSAIYRVADISRLWLEIQIPQEQLSIIAPGMLVSVVGHAEGVTAELRTVGRTVDTGTQTAIVRAELVGATEQLNPGQFVSVRVTTDSLHTGAPVWAIPTSAVTRSGTESHVFVRSPGGFERRDVTLVGSDQELSYVIQGINADMQIAIRGVAALKAQWSTHEEPGA